MDKCFSYKTPLLCNQKCFFCVTNARYHDQEYEISIKKVITDFMELKNKGYNFISIEGGEPTIISNLDKIINIGNKMGFNMSIITNGNKCSKKYLQKLYDTGLKKITFSIHSHQEEIHDYLTQMPGSYAKVMQGIKYSLNIGYATSTNSVICKQNQANISQMVEFININFPNIDRVSFCNIEANQENTQDYNNKAFMFGELDVIKESISKINHNNVIIDNLPLCAFGYDKIHLAIIGKRDEQGNQGFSSGENNLSHSKIKNEKCKICKMESYCGGFFPYFDGKNIQAFDKKIKIDENLNN